MTIFIACMTAMTLNAGWITSAQGFVAQTIPSKMNTVETAGTNPRLYAFTVTKENGAQLSMQCVIVYTEQDLGEKNAKSTAPVMQCIKL